MKPIRIAKNIVALGDFKVHASQFLRELKESHCPVVITQNGKPAAVLVTPEEFDSLNERGRFIEAVQEGLADVKAGRVFSHQEVMGELKAKYGTKKKK